MKAIFAIVCLLSLSLTGRANDYALQKQLQLQLSNQEIHQLIASFCSLYSGHISAIKTNLIFQLHQWKINQNTSSNLDIEGECSMPVDLTSKAQIQKGEAFHFIQNLQSQESLIELNIEFTHGIGTAKFERESVFNPELQSLESKWKLRSITLVPTPYKIQSIKNLPIISWVLESIRPIQQTHYRLAQSLKNEAGESFVKFESMRDLFTLGLWTQSQGRIIKINMASAPQFAWGNISLSGENSDAVFWGTETQMWGCSNFKETGRGLVTADGCQKIYNEAAKLN